MSSDDSLALSDDWSESDEVDSDSDFDAHAAEAPRRPRCAPPAAAAAAAAEEDTPPGADARHKPRSGAAGSDVSPEVSPSFEAALSAYELERAARIEANKKRLAELVQLPAALGAAAGVTKPKAQKRRRVPLAEVQVASRGSARLRGEKAPLAELDEHDRVLDPSTVATTADGEEVRRGACACDSGC